MNGSVCQLFSEWHRKTISTAGSTWWMTMSEISFYFRSKCFSIQNKQADTRTAHTHIKRWSIEYRYLQFAANAYELNLEIVELTCASRSSSSFVLAACKTLHSVWIHHRLGLRGAEEAKPISFFNFQSMRLGSIGFPFVSQLVNIYINKIYLWCVCVLKPSSAKLM